MPQPMMDSSTPTNPQVRASAMERNRRIAFSLTLMDLYTTIDAFFIEGTISRRQGNEMERLQYTTRSAQMRLMHPYPGS